MSEHKTIEGEQLIEYFLDEVKGTVRKTSGTQMGIVQVQIK